MALPERSLGVNGQLHAPVLKLVPLDTGEDKEVIETDAPLAGHEGGFLFRLVSFVGQKVTDKRKAT